MAQKTENGQGNQAGLLLRKTSAKVPVGRLVIAPLASKVLFNEDISRALARHMSGDWGHLDEVDWKTNDDALEYGGRLDSRYRTRQGIWFWVITEADRSVTTFLLAEEY